MQLLDLFASNTSVEKRTIAVLFQVHTCLANYKEIFRIAENLTFLNKQSFMLLKTVFKLRGFHYDP